MKRNRKLIITGAAIAAIICCCIVVGAYILWNIPLGTPLAVMTISDHAPGDINPPTMDALPEPSIPIQQTAIDPDGTCGRSGSLNILVLGVDSPFPFGPTGPLDIRLIKIDFTGKSAVVFSFPKDLWGPVTGLEGFGITQSRLRDAYLLARNSAGYSVGDSTSLIAQALANNYGAKSDHYITANLSTLAAIIDIMGGITVQIPVPYDGTPYGFHYFPAGPYFMNGMLALEYAVAPSSGAMWVALDRKTLILSTVFHRIFSPDVLPRLPVLIPQFLQVASTDLSLQQIMDLVCIVQKIPSSQIITTGVSPEDVTFGPDGALFPNSAIIQTKVRQYLLNE